jgi:hypothetical protein
MIQMNSSLVMLSVQRKTTRSVMRSTEMYDMIAHSEHKVRWETITHTKKN